MSLFTETLLISLCMIGLSALSLLSPYVRKQSKLLYLMGTGGLSGILIFHLLPDLKHMGGNRSLGYAGIVWAIYSLFHFLHLRNHKNGGSGHDHSKHNITFFLISMISHCLASGMLLAISETFSIGIRHSIFGALLFHKIYESLTVASVLIEKQSSRAKAIASISVYSISLPIGVILTSQYREVLTPEIAIFATSLAAGTLLGCLIFDFLIPSFHRLQNRGAAIGWILAGLFTSQLIMRM